jgi:hypothetical protein
LTYIDPFPIFKSKSASVIKLGRFIETTYFFELLRQPLVLFCQRLDEDALLLLRLPLRVRVLRQGPLQLGQVQLELVHPLHQTFLNFLADSIELGSNKLACLTKYWVTKLDEVSSFSVNILSVFFGNHELKMT